MLALFKKSVSIGQSILQAEIERLITWVTVKKDEIFWLGTPDGEAVIAVLLRSKSNFTS